ncbi:MAG: ABC transporter permease, partial [Mucilaginibacter polytrichastri]|nr:ABC transporter permease [Mucilaginibacter polytrichastri]
MIRNYFKIAFRNLWKHKGFSMINIIGLSVGMTAFFLIFLYVTFELSYDRFHTKVDRIYRIVCDIKTPTETIKASGPSWAVPAHIMAEFPEIEASVRVAGNNSFLVRKGDIKFQEENTAFVDSAFLSMFDFKLIAGSRKSALAEPYSLVLTQSTARKYFGAGNPLGQTLLLTGEGTPARVTGVIADFPENSFIKADLLISMKTVTEKMAKGIDDQWGNYSPDAYILLKSGTHAKALEKKMPAFLNKYNGKEMKQMQMFPTLFLESFKDVYLRSTRGTGSNTGNINNVYIFSVVGLFILLIACINFINLTTARSAERAKEVGIRKVAGALKNQLAWQFIGESVLLCLLAFVFTLIFVVLLLPVFNHLAGKTISSGIFPPVSSIVMLFFIATGIGLLAGLYPALVLSSFRPIMVLKGRFVSGNKGGFLRKALVVIQFTVSIAMIIGTIVVYRQMQFMQGQDLGFTKTQTLVVNTNGDPARDAFSQAVRSIPNVKSTALSASVPGSGNAGAYSEIENTKGALQIANLDLYFVDFDYLKLYDMKLVAGRGFSRDFMSDTTKAMVLNEAAVKMFGYTSPQQAVGKRFKQWGREGQIIGVVKDFHFRSLQEQIKPLSMRIEPQRFDLVSIKLNTKDSKATMAAVEKKWREMVPNRPFTYFFLDEFFDRQYRAEQRFGSLFLNFAMLAIFISCLGLLGLASYSTMQRTREIGIRKVLGASVPGIVNLLSIDFFKLVCIALIVA